MKRALLFWSGGKDCAWALREFEGRVTALVTTFDSKTRRIPMHDVPLQWIERQAEQLRIPLLTVPLPFPCSNGEYLAALSPVLARADVDAVVFGDLFLEDIRRFREASLKESGLQAMFPLWGRSTARLSRDMIACGLTAVVTAIDRAKLAPEFLGKAFNNEFLDALPEGVDPCGENGEFHTFVHEPNRLFHR